MEDNEELIKITDDESSKKEDGGAPSIKINLNKNNKNRLDHFDINYRPPDYHSEEEIELFKI